MNKKARNLSFMVICGTVLCSFIIIFLNIQSVFTQNTLQKIEFEKNLTGKIKNLEYFSIYGDGLNNMSFNVNTEISFEGLDNFELYGGINSLRNVAFGKNFYYIKQEDNKIYLVHYGHKLYLEIEGSIRDVDNISLSYSFDYENDEVILTVKGFFETIELSAPLSEEFSSKINTSDSWITVPYLNGEGILNIKSIISI